MDRGVNLVISAGTMAAMTPEQLKSLQENVLAEGLWETVKEPLRIDGGDYLGIYLPGIFVGIEKDGYCHS